LAKAQTPAEVYGLGQYIMLFATLVQLILMAIQVYYAAQSASSSDIAGLKNATEQQTNTIEKIVSGAERTLEAKLGAVISNAGQLTKERLAHFGRLPTYTVKRSVPVTRERRRQSDQVGVVQVGDLVTVRRFDGKWVAIDFYDFTRGQASSGWVVKKYLRRLP
jgi:hypothetical protein